MGRPPSCSDVWFLRKQVPSTQLLRLLRRPVRSDLGERCEGRSSGSWDMASRDPVQCIEERAKAGRWSRERKRRTRTGAPLSVIRIEIAAHRGLDALSRLIGAVRATDRDKTAPRRRWSSEDPHDDGDHSDHCQDSPDHPVLTPLGDYVADSTTCERRSLSSFIPRGHLERHEAPSDQHG